MELPIYNIIFNEDIDDISGICAMSFVEEPANEVQFLALSSQTKELNLNKNTKKQVLTGVVLRPEQLIYRYDTTYGEHYIKFSVEQIEKIAQKMMKTGLPLHNTTHQHEKQLQGHYLTELWIVENPNNDKSNELGFSDLPKGTLMCSYKIEDANYWNNEVMTGNVKGFSLEGYFDQERVKFSKNNNMNKKKKNTKKSLLSKLAAFLSDLDSVENADNTDSGTAYEIFTLANGTELYVDEDKFCTIDDEQAPAGEHPLADGSILVISDSGEFIETKSASQSANDPDEATAPQTLSKIAKLEAEAGEKDAEIASLKSEIAELKSKIAELEDKLKKEEETTTELRRAKPTAQPVTANLNKQSKPISEMEGHERMALALQQTLKNKK